MMAPGMAANVDLLRGHKAHAANTLVDISRQTNAINDKREPPQLRLENTLPNVIDRFKYIMHYKPAFELETKPLAVCMLSAVQLESGQGACPACLPFCY